MRQSSVSSATMLTFLDEVISEEKKKLGLLHWATQRQAQQEDFAKQEGN